MAKQKFERTKPHVNIGTIGHVDHGMLRCPHCGKSVRELRPDKTCPYCGKKVE